MSQQYMDEEFDSDLIQESADGEGDSGDIRSLRRAANSKKKLEQELAEAKRQLAFAKAGIDIEDPKMKYFVRGYDGEMTAAAVKAAAAEAGFVQLSTGQADNPAQQMAASAQERVMQASSGAVAEDVSEESALMRMQEAMNEGGMDAMLDVARQYGIPIGTEM
jgi:hypothetical protein